MRTHARERRPNPGMLAKINRALARHAPWFPDFLLSPISSFPTIAPLFNLNFQLQLAALRAGFLNGFQFCLNHSPKSVIARSMNSSNSGTVKAMVP